MGVDMKAKVVALAGAAVLLVGAPSRPADAETLKPGTYIVTAYIAPNSFTQTFGNFCFPNVENAYGLIASFSITYNGAGKTATATIPVPFIPAVRSNPLAGPFMAFLALPKTPQTGTQWNGSYTEVLQPVDATFLPSPFTATLTVTSPLSFLGTMTLNAFSSGIPRDNLQNICNITLQYAAVFAGPVN